MTEAPPAMTEAERVARLEPPTDGVRLVLDTDTDNEIDDQFALVYALLAEELDVEAVYAAPYTNDRSSGPADGMERSYEEINRLLDFLNEDPSGFVYRGSERYLDDGRPVESPAAADLVERALAVDANTDPLYVVAIGVPTNVASALRQAPNIADSIVVVWLGGNPQYWPTARHFNLQQDLEAARTLFDSGVPLVHVPCINVAEHVTTSVAELERHLGDGPLCTYLREIFAEYGDRRWPDRSVWTKEIWDLTPIAWLVDPDWVPSALVHSPELTDQLTWNRDPNRHLIREARHADRDRILADVVHTIGDR